MSSRTIGNGQWRKLLHADEVPAAVMLSDFDHIDAEDAGYGFISYRGMYFHLSDFLHHDGEYGYYCLSAFETVRIEISGDGERYRVARILS